ncbi:translation initiation factor IF-3 [Helicobacter saguini]|uniref:Translation initiation factor IF-3 n=1 Tax=Helicobacter saguini TaxID=1548018 RepID=A0A347VN10_9HELI|nr:translation initiation factor IF-3 [Helicobacter saguini]MWV61946.1 translation initiation factor IF-3 [Helicobacter saguini]MWV67379.1 translation initiation factor IF-3 [Helicobacter saguini]MWV69732.1 translation initiation factor IF-3 [Helicobacter saguini]MWV73051.1 translation initiation factor IF-3 [Helicobacter saguini]TLD95574.1 translation initiation factor IF-3 [Helicobacter saguini]
MSKDDTLVNNQIRFEQVRCVSEDGEQLGVMSSKEAQNLANEQGLDLVCISPNATPPVCKIVEFGKYRYQLEKKRKEAKKKQKQVEVKEIKLSTQIAQNDINYKVRHAREFFEEGKHVKFRVYLRGREIQNPGQAFEILKKVCAMVEDLAHADKEAKVEGKYASILMLPNKKA